MNKLSAGPRRDDPARTAQWRRSEEADTVDLSQLLRRLWRRKEIIVLTTLLIAGAVSLIVSQVTPRYTAIAKIMLDPRERRVVSSEEVISTLDLKKAVIETEVGFIRSGVVLENAVRKSVEAPDRIRSAGGRRSAMAGVGGSGRYARGGHRGAVRPAGWAAALSSRRTGSGPRQCGDPREGHSPIAAGNRRSAPVAGGRSGGGILHHRHPSEFGEPAACGGDRQFHRGQLHREAACRAHVHDPARHGLARGPHRRPAAAGGVGRGGRGNVSGPEAGCRWRRARHRGATAIGDVNPARGDRGPTAPRRRRDATRSAGSWRPGARRRGGGAEFTPCHIAPGEAGRADAAGCRSRRPATIGYTRCAWA